MPHPSLDPTVRGAVCWWDHCLSTLSHAGTGFVSYLLPCFQHKAWCEVHVLELINELGMNEKEIF